MGQQAHRRGRHAEGVTSRCAAARAAPRLHARVVISGLAARQSDAVRLERTRREAGCARLARTARDHRHGPAPSRAC
ncbi:hypothetical protein LUTEI9C_40099 [Luteimonas sp. 9C]|nr:hypothetical protein LUTEI9C_40099 [Luteimonas sp. 9C]